MLQGKTIEVEIKGTLNGSKFEIEFSCHVVNSHWNLNAVSLIVLGCKVCKRKVEKGLQIRAPISPWAVPAKWDLVCMHVQWLHLLPCIVSEDMVQSFHAWRSPFSIRCKLDERTAVAVLSLPFRLDLEERLSSIRDERMTVWCFLEAEWEVWDATLKNANLGLEKHDDVNNGQSMTSSASCKGSSTRISHFGLRDSSHLASTWPWSKFLFLTPRSSSLRTEDELSGLPKSCEEHQVRDDVLYRSLIERQTFTWLTCIAWRKS